MSRIFISIVILACFIAAPVHLNAQAQTGTKPAEPQQKIKWYSFMEAYNLNKKKPKKIFVDVYTDWCGWCKKMDATTFMNPEIAKYMNDNFYCVKMNAEMKDTLVIDGVTFLNPNPAASRSSHQLAIELLRGKMSYPSYVFLNDKSQWLTVVTGYQEARQFETVIHYFGDNAYNGTAWEDYRSSFKGKIE